jgi:hypothetical protein
VNIFCPDGYVPIPDAVLAAAKFWFPLQINLPLQPQVLDRLLNSLNEAAHRLRKFQHQGKLKAYYFGNDGRHSVSRDFWAMTDADEVMESGIYWPFGKSPQLAPNYLSGLLRNYPLFLLQSELDVLLSEQPSKKRPLPREKMPDLATGLRELDHLPNRPAQLQALRDMPKFREFIITNAVFREAAKLAGPRRAGRKSRRQS